MKTHSLICAIGTPVSGEDKLDREGLEAHLEDQWKGGITGILAGGTMGAMQMLRDDVYADLLRATVSISRHRGEVMAGIGDTCLSRTLARAATARAARADSVVVLCPFFILFSQDDLISYFKSIADRSELPVYLYDLPALTGTALEVETVAQLARYPNIAGIKCSRDVSFIRRLIELDIPGFRVIAAQPEVADVLLRQGYREHLDGVFGLAPAWATEIFTAANRGDWIAAADAQRRFSKLLVVLRRYGVFPTFSAILNARGIPGSFAPAPFRPLRDETREQVLAEPIVRELLTQYPEAKLATGSRRRVAVEVLAGDGHARSSECKSMSGD